jgi:hypothetical protein
MFSFFVYLEIENDFKRKLQEHVAKLDSEKAVLLAKLEKELDVRQELILESARKRIDDLNEEANRLKLVCSTSIPISSNSFFYFFRVFLKKLKLKARIKSVSILNSLYGLYLFFF